VHGHKPQAFLVTLWTYGLEPVFAEPARAALFCHSLATLRHRLGFLVHAYVVLPDRVRLILASRGGDMRWARMIAHRLKSRYAREANTRSGRRGLVWQDGDQTLPLRDTEDVRRKADYLHHNPVLAGLARHAGDWRWSSYRAWAGGRRTPLTVDLPARDRAPAAAKPCVST